MSTEIENQASRFLDFQSGPLGLRLLGESWRAMLVRSADTDYRKVPPRLFDLMQAGFPAPGTRVYMEIAGGMDSAVVDSWQAYEKLMQSRKEEANRVLVVAAAADWVIFADEDSTTIAGSKAIFAGFEQAAARAGIDLRRAIVHSWGIADDRHPFMMDVLSMFDQ